MLFGYVSAVVAGFLLTAVPNWTGRLPLQGRPLAILFSVWVIGRIAVSSSAWLGWAPAMIIEAAFLVLLAAAAARETIAGKKWGNFNVVLIVSLFAAGNLAFHLEAHYSGSADYATRAGIALVIVLITLIGGRIIPSFTRNWLAKRKPGPMPAPFGRFDIATVASSAIVLALWVARPFDATTGALLLLCGCMHVVRLARWSGYRTFEDRLVLILHVAYAFVPAGFILTALSAFDVVAPSAGIHAWTGGAIGGMTLAVMSRHPRSYRAAVAGVGCDSCCLHARADRRRLGASLRRIRAEPCGPAACDRRRRMGRRFPRLCCDLFAAALDIAPVMTFRSRTTGEVMSTETIDASERVIDVRDIEPRFRHQIIHQLVEHLAPDSSLQLIADHRPQPLRYQLALRFGAQCVCGPIWRRGRTSGVSGSPRRPTPIRHRKTSKAARCLRAALKSDR
jgi:hypothetical protein